MSESFPSLWEQKCVYYCVVTAALPFSLCVFVPLQKRFFFNTSQYFIETMFLFLSFGMFTHFVNFCSLYPCDLILYYESRILANFFFIPFSTLGDSTPSHAVHLIRLWGRHSECSMYLHFVLLLEWTLWQTTHIWLYSILLVSNPMTEEWMRALI